MMKQLREKKGGCCRRRTLVMIMADRGDNCFGIV